MTRQTKTPRQRAEATLAVAQRRVDRISSAVEHQRGLLQVYESDLGEAEQRLEYAKRDPALPTTPSTTNQAGDTTA